MSEPLIMTQTTRRNARLIALGMMVLGFLAIVLPFYVGVAAAMVLGASIALTGLSGLWMSRRLSKVGYATWDLPFWGYLVIGVLLLLWPQLTLGLAALLLGASLILSGILAWQRSQGQGGWAKVTSVLTLILGILVVGSGASGVAWLIGVAFGLSLLQQGWQLWQTVSRTPVIWEGR